MKYIDLFAGIGGFRTAFDQQGFDCVFSSEIDKQAARAYHLLYGEEPTGDITKINAEEIPDHDILCAGFPCQAFSIVGNQKGFADTRGTLFFDIARIAKEKQPRLLVLENVRNLLSHKKGHTFRVILQKLDEIGFDAEWRVLNAKDFGLAQNRERTIIIGHSRKEPLREVLPVGRKSENACKVVGRVMAIKGHDYNRRIYDPTGLSKTLPTVTGGSLEPKIIVKDHGRLRELENTANCIDANYHKGFDNHGQRTGIQEGERIRKLTPLECFRLQGFPDKYHDILRVDGYKDSPLYRFAGNAAPVPMIEAVAKRIKEVYPEW